jgi:hypothetical protein
MTAMKASEGKLRAAESEPKLAVQADRSACREAADNEVDVSLLEDSLSKTPWERMQANDDALSFAGSLHAAMRTGCKT